MFLGPADFDLIVDVVDAEDAFSEFLGEALGAAVGDGAFNSDLALFGGDFDLGGIEIAVAGQELTDVVFDALVGALIPPGAAPGERAWFELIQSVVRI